MRSSFILLLATASLQFFPPAAEGKNCPDALLSDLLVGNAETVRHLQQNPAPAARALLRHYIKQQTDSACSLASMTMVLNALRQVRRLKAPDVLTQNSLMRTVGDRIWMKRTATSSTGIALDELGELAVESLRTHGIRRPQVEVVHASQSAEFRKKLDQALRAQENGESDFLIGNFLQSRLTGDPAGAEGHFSPLAAYDSQRGRVLVLDPDPAYEPYWVSLDDLIQAMLAVDSDAGRTRGFLWVKAE